MFIDGAFYLQSADFGTMFLSSFRLTPSICGMTCKRSFSHAKSNNSPLSPTFSTCGDSKKLVTKLGLANVFNVIIQGNPNTTLPSDCVTKDFLPGASKAVGLVTKAAAEGDWDRLEGLVEPQCINSLMEQLEGMGEVERAYVMLNPNDVFFSFISEPRKDANDNYLNIVIYSLPGLEHIVRRVSEIEMNTQIIQANVLEEAKESLLKGKMKKSWLDLDLEVSKVIEEDSEMGKMKDKIVEVFATNEIVIGSYQLVRDSVDSEWTLCEAGQMRMKVAFILPFSVTRWRLLLGLSFRFSKPFLNVLRINYLIQFIVLFGVIILALKK